MAASWPQQRMPGSGSLLPPPLLLLGCFIPRQWVHLGLHRSHQEPTPTPSPSPKFASFAERDYDLPRSSHTSVTEGQGPCPYESRRTSCEEDSDFTETRTERFWGPTLQSHGLNSPRRVPQAHKDRVSSPGVFSPFSQICRCL